MIEDFQGDAEIFSWFRNNSYNAQTSTHINAVCDILLHDLVAASDIIADAAKNGGLVYSRNYSLNGPSFLDEIDLVVGPPRDSPQQQFTTSGPVIQEGGVKEVWLAIDFESLISSIEKNWKNRGQDIHSFYLSVYEHYPTAITGAVVLYNTTALDTWDPNHLVNEYMEFELARGSLAKRLDSLLVIPFDNAIGDATRSSVTFDGDDLTDYESTIMTLSEGLETRIQGDFDIDDATVEALLNYQESPRLEFKRAVGDRTQDIAKEAVALANNEGGRILYGVSNNGVPVGLSDIEKAEERISQILSDTIIPNIVSRIDRHKVNGKDILAVKINQAREIPASHNGIFYTRTGTTTSKLTGQEILDNFPKNSEETV